MTAKMKATIGKVNKWDYIKEKGFCTSNEKEKKKTVASKKGAGETIFENYI